MARRNLIRSKILPYHVVNQVNNREWFHLPLEGVWELFNHELYRVHMLWGIQVHAFVLMANHYHLLVSTPEADLGQAMKDLVESVTQLYNLKSGRVGHLFRGRYKWSLIQSPLHFSHAVKYVYRNPVKAGICDRVEDYRFSTLQGILGLDRLHIPLFPLPDHLPTPFRPADYCDLLPWLNEPHRAEELEAIRKGLRRRIFEPPQRKDKRGPLPLGTTPS